MPVTIPPSWCALCGNHLGRQRCSVPYDRHPGRGRACCVGSGGGVGPYAHHFGKKHAASVSEGGYPCGYLVPMLEMGCNTPRTLLQRSCTCSSCHWPAIQASAAQAQHEHATKQTGQQLGGWWPSLPTQPESGLLSEWCLPIRKLAVCPATYVPLGP